MWLVVACVCAAAACRLMRNTAEANLLTNATDLYNSASGTWSTAQLSVRRQYLKATSVGNIAIFAGGMAGSASNTCFTKCFEELCLLVTRG